MNAGQRLTFIQVLLTFLIIASGIYIITILPKPEPRSPEPAQWVVREIEGCKVYGFRGGDGYVHYFSTCEGRVDNKIPSGRTRRDDSITTSIKPKE